jgi:L-threonylcarbamoyladenylate synthase
VVGLAPPRLLRLGHIGRAELEAVVGPLIDGTAATGQEDGAQPSPGMLLRHYAPDAEVILVPAGDGQALREASQASEGATGALLHSLPASGPHQLELPNDPVGYARELYDGLHRLDASCSRILVEDVPPSPDWDAVRDRLRRAAHREEAD